MFKTHHAKFICTVLEPVQENPEGKEKQEIFHFNHLERGPVREKLRTHVRVIIKVIIKVDHKDIKL